MSKSLIILIEIFPKNEEIHIKEITNLMKSYIKLNNLSLLNAKEPERVVTELINRHTEGTKTKESRNPNGKSLFIKTKPATYRLK